MLLQPPRSRGKQAPAGPRGSFFSGAAAAVRDHELAFYSLCEREYGGIVRNRVWHIPLFVVTDPALIEEVLTQKSASFIKPLGVRAIKHAFGDGLLTSEGEHWRAQRKIVQPAFHSRRMIDYGSVMTQAAQSMLAHWQGDQTRNVHQDMIDVCLEIIARTMFGDAMEDGRARISAAASSVQEFSRAHRNFFRPNPFLLPVPVNFRYRRAVRRLNEYVSQVIRDRRMGSDSGTGDLLSLLLGARDADGKPLPDRQVRDEIVTMFLAGHETAASALSWSLYLVAKHPEIAQKLHAEVEQVLGDRAPTYLDVDKLPYTEQVIKEAFRLFPPVQRIGRTAIEDCEIGGYAIPKGSEVIMPQWAVHRSARYFDNPDVFLPERWTPEFARALPKFAFFPFSGGPRQCIGSSFVLKEDILILAAIVQQFRFELPAGFEAKPHEAFTLLPQDAYLPLRLTRVRPAPEVSGEQVAARPAAPPTSRCPFHAAASLFRRE